MLIPTRDRKDLFLTAVRSVNRTSKAHVMAYMDTDAPEYPDMGGAEVFHGPRVGPARGWAALAKKAFTDGYDAVATMTDDSVVMTPGWDDWVEEVISVWPIAVVSPRCADSGVHRVDMPLVTKAFVEAVGWFIHPELFHYAWPSVIDALSDGICLFKAPQDKFHIRHNQVGAESPTFSADSRKFYEWYAWHKDDHRAMLRKAVEASTRGLTVSVGGLSWPVTSAV